MTLSPTPATGRPSCSIWRPVLAMVGAILWAKIRGRGGDDEAKTATTLSDRSE